MIVSVISITTTSVVTATNTKGSQEDVVTQKDKLYQIAREEQLKEVNTDNIVGETILHLRKKKQNETVKQYFEDVLKDLIPEEYYKQMRELKVREIGETVVVRITGYAGNLYTIEDEWLSRVEPSFKELTEGKNVSWQVWDTKGTVTAFSNIK